MSSKRLPEKRQSHIGCICLTFLHFDFSNVSSNCLHEKLHNHIVCFKTKVFNVCIGKAWAWAIMCIFKLCPLEDGLAHISHDDSLPSANSDHVDLQTFPTWENFYTTYGSVSAGREKRPFNVLFFLKVEPPCDQTWWDSLVFSILSCFSYVVHAENTLVGPVGPF